MERRVVDGVAVDLADVEVLFYLVHLVGYDPVRDTPDLFGCGVMVIRQLFPIGPLDQGYDAAGGLRRSAVVLAGWEKRKMSVLVKA